MTTSQNAVQTSPEPSVTADDPEVVCEISMAVIEEGLERLLRGDRSDLDAYLTLIDKQIEIDGLKVNVHCHAISCNQNGARIGDFARMIASQIVDYAIPRSEFTRAKAQDEKHKTDRYSQELRAKAKGMFTNLTKTGEGGEMLLYMLLQTYLRLPQLLCKMALKTSGHVHVHGVDGVHVDVDSKTGRLLLYWGEAKLYKSLSAALRKSLKSLNTFLTDSGGSGSPLERDIFLLKDFLDLNDPKIERAILTFLDRNNPAFNQVEYRGAALVGFDSKSYPLLPNQKSNDAVISALKSELPEWLKLVREQLKGNQVLSTYSLEIFLVPFPTVAEFRKSFLKEIG